MTYGRALANLPSPIGQLEGFEGCLPTVAMPILRTSEAFESFEVAQRES
jgi:hypothetical protein